MKKIIILIIAMMMAISLCACGNSDDNKSEDKPASGSSNEVAITEIASEDPLAEDVSALEAIGDVEVIDGIAYVYITMPAELMEGITQGEIDAQAGETYQSGKLNDDGSVTYKMSRKQHKAMLDELTNSIAEACNEMVNDVDTYGITAIDYNKDFTTFKVTLNSGSVNFVTALSAIAFYYYGGMYGIFNGKRPDNVSVEFYSPDGTLIETSNSSDMGE